MSEPRHQSQADTVCVHHVGGRNGSGSFAVVPAFARDLVNVYYEADQDAVAQIENVQRLSGSTFHVLPYCLGESNGPGKLHINFDPYTSSLLPTADRDDDHLVFHGFDYRYRESLRTMETREVAVRRLDDIDELSNRRIPLPDILSLDTQGSEYEILAGGKNVARHALAIICEVEFLELYERQHSFGDIASTLGELGFEFVDFTHLSRSQPYRQPLGMRGKGFTNAADALFCRRLTLIDRDPIALKKMAFIAHVLNQHALGFECMQRYIRGDFPVSSDRPTYSLFLDELSRAVDVMPKLLPWTFGELRSFENSRKRFDDAKRIECDLEYAAARRRYAAYLHSQHDTLAMLLRPEPTPVEAVFAQYGMEHQVRTLRSIRIANATECLNAAGAEFGLGNGVTQALAPASVV